MSLDWSTKHCKENVWGEQVEAVIDSIISDRQSRYSFSFITEAIIWEMLAVDIGAITEKNVTEFIIRSQFWRRTALGIKSLPDDFFTASMVRRRIGLTTNVTNRTWSQFVKRHADGFRRDIEAKFRREEMK